MKARASISRRKFLQGMGAFVVSFNLSPSMRNRAHASSEDLSNRWPDAHDQIATTPDLDSWLRIDEGGEVTFFTGSIELGTGVLTALSQIVAEELSVPFESVSVISADTDIVPYQGVTSFTVTIRHSGVVLRKAAATARQALLEIAADKLETDIQDLQVRDGIISAQGQVEPSVSYGELIGNQQFERTVDEEAAVRSPDTYQIVGQPVPRIDFFDKLTATDNDFRENSRISNMKFARTLRGPAYGAKLKSFDESVADLPGVIAVLPFHFPGDERLERVENLETMPGDFIAVVADSEGQAMVAVEQLRETAVWDADDSLPTTHEEVYDWMLENAKPVELRDDYTQALQQYQASKNQVNKTITATYRFPYQCYGPISPAWSLADVKEDEATVWSATQGPFHSRWMVSQALGFDRREQVRIIGGSSSGLFGRRDDYDNEVDVEAALISQAIGAPVRLQWTREEEFVWGQYRPPHIAKLEAGLDDTGQIDGLHVQLWTAVRGEHPIVGGMAQLLDITPYRMGPKPIEAYDAGPLLRTGFMRNVFRGHNSFALESFIDELANHAGEDPVEFRLKHLDNERAIEAISTAAERVGWKQHIGPSGRGIGISYAAYWEDAPHMAYIAEVDVNEDSGEVQVKRMTCVVDAGLVINPDGFKNQVEGGVIQAMSWCLKEEITFDQKLVTSRDWRTYPILTFPEVPEIDVVIIDRKNQPAAGIGEPVTVPVASAIANAFFDATGARLRQQPFTPDRVKSALSTA